MADIQVNFQDEQPIHVDVTYDQINVDFNDRPIDVSIEDAQPISVDLENAQPINVSLGEAVNIFYGEGGPDKHFIAPLSGQEDIIITHNLNKLPSVTVVDSAGDGVLGDFIHLDNNNTRLIFSAGFSGKAIFN